jgi:hypothetical protein
MRVGTNLVFLGWGQKPAIQTSERPFPLPQKNGCEQVKSDIRLINSVTWQDGQHNSTEKVKPGGRSIFQVRKDFQFELHSARKL